MPLLISLSSIQIWGDIFMSRILSSGFDICFILDFSDGLDAQLDVSRTIINH